jgi:hypothetical protein
VTEEEQPGERGPQMPREERVFQRGHRMGCCQDAKRGKAQKDVIEFAALDGSCCLGTAE